MNGNDIKTEQMFGRVKLSTISQSAIDDMYRDGSGRLDSHGQAFVSGEKTEIALRTLAKEMSECVLKESECKIDEVADSRGCTLPALELLRKFEDAIQASNNASKKSLESVRTFRMAITSEVTQIEKALTTLNKINFDKLVENMGKLKNLMTDPSMKAIAKGICDAESK